MNIDLIHYKNIKNLVDKDDIKNFKSYLELNDIDINANFSNISKKNDSILFYCIKNNKIQFIDYLLELPHIKINTPNSDSITPIMHCIIFKKNEIFDKLIQHPHPGLAFSGDNENIKLHPMTRAAQAKNLDMVKKIAAHPENDWAVLKNAPFFYAFSAKQTEMGTFIINHPSFDPYEQVSLGYPLNFLIEYENKKGIIALLNKENFNPNIPVTKTDIHGNGTGQEPLWWRSFNFLNSLETAKRKVAFLNHPKIDINIKNTLGKTILSHHIDDVTYFTFDALVENKKIDINILNEKNHTILEELLFYKTYGDRDQSRRKEKVELVVNRIIKEATNIKDYIERLENINNHEGFICESKELRDWSLANFRHLLLKEKISQNNQDKVILKKRKI